MAGAVERMHATAIAAGGRAALIVGPSGSGKSDLALRCLTLPQSPLTGSPVILVSDDQVIVERSGTGLVASAPQAISGLLEVRGIGPIRTATAASAEVALVVELTSRENAGPRLPDPWPVTRILGLHIPVLKLWPFEGSAAHKVLIALAAADLPPVAP